jgi:hypothetical protein
MKKNEKINFLRKINFLSKDINSYQNLFFEYFFFFFFDLKETSNGELLLDQEPNK